MRFTTVSSRHVILHNKLILLNQIEYYRTMMEYCSIKEEVIRKLSASLPEIRDRFAVKSLCIFGSVSRGEDTPESDIDILYTFFPGGATMRNLEGLQAYLEQLLGRDIDLIAEKWLNPAIRPIVFAEAIIL